MKGGENMQERLNGNKQRCLQEQIGSCGGCNIQGIVLEKRLSMNKDDEGMLIKRVMRVYCPEGNQLLVPMSRR